MIVNACPEAWINSLFNQCTPNLSVSIASASSTTINTIPRPKEDYHFKVKIMFKNEENCNFKAAIMLLR